jgi:transforming growth factor-beta-induced protein
MRANAKVGRLTLLAGLMALSATSCGSSDASPATTTAAAPASSTSVVGSTTSTSLPAPTKSILELAQAEGQLTTLLKLLDTAGLTTTLKGDGPFTLVAPTDAAFAKMNPDTLDRISKSPEVLKQLLQYHIVPARITTKDVAAGSVTTTEGTAIALQATSKLPTVNGLTVSRGARATNGTILVIESVLLPVDLKLP